MKSSIGTFQYHIFIYSFVPYYMAHILPHSRAWVNPTDTITSPFPLVPNIDIIWYGRFDMDISYGPYDFHTVFVILFDSCSYELYIYKLTICICNCIWNCIIKKNNYLLYNFDKPNRFLILIASVHHWKEKTNWRAIFYSFIMFVEWVIFLAFVFMVIRLATSKLEYN